MIDPNNPATPRGRKSRYSSNPDGCLWFERLADGSVELSEDTDREGNRLVFTDGEWEDIRQKAKASKLSESCLVYEDSDDGNVHLWHRDRPDHVLKTTTLAWGLCLRSLEEGEFDDLEQVVTHD